MSMKGKVFTIDDLKKSLAAKMSPAQIRAWCERETARYRIVAMDGNNPVIAEELDQRALNRLSPKARRIAGMIARLDAATAKEVVGAFDQNGRVRNPFTEV